MRAELRAKLPRTQGCGALIVVVGLAVVAVAGYFVWNWVKDTPSRMVQKVMTQARHGNVQGMRRYLTDESLQNPSCDAWLQQLSLALGTNSMLRNAEVVGEEGTVHILVVQRSGTGLETTTDLGVKAVRVAKRGWLIDLERTMASVTPQFWESISATGQ
jgi:hypothetical protein